jgi:phosphohistidine phosphatase
VKRLYLLRHAKSSWDDPGLADSARPLAPRGRKAVKRIAGHLRAAEIAPDLVLCSTAERTRQTLAGILEALPAGVEIRLDEWLYGAGAAEVLARVRETGAEVGALLVIGHNPTLHELALRLTGRDDALERFPTGALAAIAFAGPWTALGDEDAELEAVWTPRPPRRPR